jgi:replicative DNA helicase
MKILEEISHRSGGVRLREDNILFLLGVKLKDLANQFGVFILSGTQLNADYKTSDTPDQNLLRGAKSLGDKIDVGMILLEVTKEDQEAIQGIVETQGYVMPNVKMSIYKNRRGSYNRLYLWMNADKGTCRFNPIFATDYQYNPIPIADTKIKVKEV